MTGAINQMSPHPSQNLFMDQRTEMRGVGGPLLTVSDLLSDLAVDGGDDHLDGGDASIPSSPLAAQQVEEADPSDLQRIFEVTLFVLIFVRIYLFPRHVISRAFGFTPRILRPAIDLFRRMRELLNCSA